MKSTMAKEIFVSHIKKTKELVEKTLRELKPKCCFWKMVHLNWVKLLPNKVMEEERNQNTGKLKEYYLSSKKGTKKKHKTTIQSVTSAQLLKFKKNFCFTVFKNFKKKKMFTLLTVVSTVLWKISLQRACIEIQTKLSNACDSGNYATLASLDLTAAFDVVDRKLLKFFLKIIGVPGQLIHLLDDWLSNQSVFCEVNKNNSELLDINFWQFRSQFWAICCLPCLFPLEDITTPTMYVGENYLFGSGKTEK